MHAQRREDPGQHHYLDCDLQGGDEYGQGDLCGTTMNGIVETTVKTGGQTMTMKSIMKGKRVGPCK